jgi:hypothetical protein
MVAFNGARYLYFICTTQHFPKAFSFCKIFFAVLYSDSKHILTRATREGLNESLFCVKIFDQLFCECLTFGGEVFCEFLIVFVEQFIFITMKLI